MSARPADYDDGDSWYINTYQCPCGEEWSDQWSACCDDDCPACGTTCSPTESEEAE